MKYGFFRRIIFLIIQQDIDIQRLRIPQYIGYAIKVGPMRFHVHQREIFAAIAVFPTGEVGIEMLHLQ